MRQRIRLLNPVKIRVYSCLFVVAVLGWCSGATNDLSTTLQQGLFEEEANHNFSAAIQAYQSLITQYDHDRKFWATAVFRLGECYRKQGNTNEAAAQYERIVHDFSDQSTLVNLSRQNLAAFGVAATTPVASSAARQEQRRLLEEEIALVENQIAMQKKKHEVGALAPDEMLPAQRDLLKLRRQLAALDAGESVSDLEAASTSASPENDELKRIEALIKDSPDLINSVAENSGVTLLQSAASKGQLAIVKSLLDHGAAVDGVRQLATTPLHYAANNGHKAVVDYLISKGANVAAQTENGTTPLHLAALKGYELVAKALVSAGAPVNAAIKNDGNILGYQFTSGQAPLHVAVNGGYAALVDFLISKGADVNAQDAQGRTPLSHAVGARNESMAKALLVAHADPNGGRRELPLF